MSLNQARSPTSQVRTGKNFKQAHLLTKLEVQDIHWDDELWTGVYILAPVRHEHVIMLTFHFFSHASSTRRSQFKVFSRLEQHFTYD